MKYCLFFLIFFASLDANAGFYRYWANTKILKRHVGMTLSLDFSKSYLNAYINFAKTRPTIRRLGRDFKFGEEIRFYGRQVKKSFFPKYILLEANYHPLTNIGVYIKNRENQLYNSSNLNIDGKIRINPFELVATRYEKPYSFSLFLGNINPFVSPIKKQVKSKKSKRKRVKSKGKRKRRRKRRRSFVQSGSSISGHTISWGNRRLIKLDEESNNWYQYTFMVKGTNITKNTKKKWLFSLGYIFHDNETFINGVTLKLVRDYASKTSHRFWNNIKMEYSVNVPTESLTENNHFKYWTSLQKIIFGKNYHFDNFVLGIETGIRWEVFKHPTKEVFTETAFILAPNLSW